MSETPNTNQSGNEPVIASSIEAVIRLFGRKEMADMLGVDPRAVSEAKTRRILPSPWYDCVDREARARNVVVSPHLFNFRPPAPPIANLEEGTTPTPMLPRVESNGCAQ